MTQTVAVQRAVRRSDLPAPARLIVLTICGIADYRTGVVPPEHAMSLTELAVATGLGRSTVARSLNLLEKTAWLTRDRPDVVAARSEGARTAYTVHVGSPVAGLPGSPRAGLVPERDYPEPDVSDIGQSQSGTTGSPAAGRIPISPTTTNKNLSSRPASDPADAVEAPPRLDVDRVCRHLADRIEANGSKRPTIGKTWRDAARLLIDRDGRTVEQILRCIDWCQDDPFWRANVLSMPKLREKYDQLRLAAQREAARPASRNTGANRHHDDRPDQNPFRTGEAVATYASQSTGSTR
ncbi:helix-turn-helix domain-containing protein [Micromonospora sp. HUAS LYJ1]|uniref:helix-turn-helix domain-containing protein n=1 Tax=Micromonospora sp. HUAS LYJ1 TaxID=3061626 RepID=UPI002670D970|nr:helix-turn-helix domain-containing protein [Micromonospora sp. HUAS LYJ1]WKU07986.1 helix-turn-helix domain-containing protein [Micromonospora sp. HUAS LYJ1]